MSDSSSNTNGFDAGKQYLGQVYAKALLGVTEKSGTTEAVLEEFDSFVYDVLERLPKLAATLGSPRVPHEHKLTLLDKAFAQRMSPSLLNFLKVVSRHGRLDCLKVINRVAHEIHNDMRGRVEVQVRTAEPVDAELLAQITAQLKAALKKDIDLRATVDPRLIGGLVVRVGDTVYDGSVANRLNRLRQETFDKTAQQIRQALDRFAVDV